MSLSFLMWLMCNSVKDMPQPKYNRRRHRTWHEIRLIKTHSSKIGFSNYELIAGLSNQPHSVMPLHNLPSNVRQWGKAIHHAIAYGNSSWSTQNTIP